MISNAEPMTTRRRGIDPDHPTTRRIIAAAESGKYKNMTCIANEIGVSRERVRQILNAVGHTEFRRRRLEWACPDCGTLVGISRAQLDRTRHMPAHCRKCASAYCRREHLRSENPSKDGRCLVCNRLRWKRVVEVRTCLECGKNLEITRGVRKQIRLGNARGIFHQECYFALLRREGLPQKGKKIKAATV